MTDPTPDDVASRHRLKMAHRKAMQDAEVASKSIAEKGLLMVNTGPGKGKSTAAFGLVLRALGHGWPVGIVQFVKGAIRLVVLDELNIALRYDYLPLHDVVAALRARRPGLHVVVTGRNAKPAMVEAADLVTEFGAAKHHFAAGVRAQAGIEF